MKNVVRIVTNRTNSFKTNDGMYLTLLKAQKISKKAQESLDFNSTLIHPKLGKMVLINA